MQGMEHRGSVKVGRARGVGMEHRGSVRVGRARGQCQGW